jgi:hypothetical protein
VTFEDWARDIAGKLRAAGYPVADYQGFPMVQCPKTYEETYKLLKFAQTLGCNRRIYAEGMIFLPPGA